MKGVAEFYDKTAVGWSDNWLEERKQKGNVEKFFDAFSLAGNLNPQILDLGCGVGYDSKILTELGADVVGIDFSEKSIEIAKQNVKKAKFFVGDITESFDKLGKFEGILCLATIPHINILKIRQMFNNFHRGLLPGGLLLVSITDDLGKNPEKSYSKIDGVEYDKNFSGYTIEQLCEFAYDKFKLVDSWSCDEQDEVWKYYVFMKI